MSARKPVPELLLEQLRLGEIAAGDERRLRMLLGSEEVERRLAQLRVEEADFAASRDPDAALREIARRRRLRSAPEQTRTKRTALLPRIAPLVALAAATLWFARNPAVQESAANESEVTKPEVEQGVRVKGLAPHLALYRLEGDQVETLLPGARTVPGDMIQLGYVAADATHGVIVSFDGRGVVSLHFPDSATSSTLLNRGGEQVLGHAYELDAAPSFERFVFVTSTHPIDVNAILAAAREVGRVAGRARTDRLALPASLGQHAFTLLKEPQ